MTITADGIREASLVRRRVLLDDWVALEIQVARVQARQAVLLAERMDLLAGDPEVSLQGGEVSLRSLATEYGAAAHIPSSTAAVRLTDAWVLVHRFPVTFAAFQAGRISRRHVDVIMGEEPEAAQGQDPDALRAAYESRVVAFAEQETAARTRVYARGVATVLAPDQVVAAHRRGRARRKVTVTPDGDGMALLIALLPEIEAYAIKDRLDAQAKQVVKARRENEAGQESASTADSATMSASVSVSSSDLVSGSAAGTSAEGEELAAVRGAYADADPPSVVGLGDVGSFSTAAVAYDTHAPDTEPAPWDPGAKTRVPADVRWADETDIAEVDAEFEALVESLRDGVPVDPFPPPPGRLYTHDRRVPEDPIGVVARDERSMDQIRADILADVLLTSDPSLSTRTGLESVRARVQVTIRATTLLGQDDRPAELDGVGPIDPEWARRLAGYAPSLDRLFLDHAGMLTATDSYTPTRSMKRFLRARDQHCRTPGCRRPAHLCEHDHNHDHAKGGATDVTNLALLCTGHHPIKHPDLDDDTRWTARQLDDGLIEWTSPLGRVYIDRPPARVMFT